MKQPLLGSPEINHSAGAPARHQTFSLYFSSRRREVISFLLLSLLHSHFPATAIRGWGLRSALQGLLMKTAATPQHSLPELCSESAARQRTWPAAIYSQQGTAGKPNQRVVALIEGVSPRHQAQQGLQSTVEKQGDSIPRESSLPQPSCRQGGLSRGWPPP